MRIDHAKLSLPGNRQDNQDRVDVFVGNGAVLMVAADGMGGHTEGARAAEATVGTLGECFSDEGGAVLDPQGFLTLALARAHSRVVELGQGLAIDHKPRATCAACLLQDGGAFWAHVGDSRVYQLRQGRVHERTRDHSHVELLRREGLIGEGEMKTHPMRNYVECCLGGESPLPNMSVTARKRLRENDVLLVCTDGLWSGLDDEEIAGLGGDGPLSEMLAGLASNAIARNNPHSDNTSAAALRWRGD